MFSCGSRQNDAGFFRYNESSGVPTLDPAFAKSQAVMWTAHQLFNTLVEVNDRLEIAPSLATRWAISD
ncbi:MAG: ABC transporter substrate-binding protein, partial [Flavihumibacter sp.]